MNADLELNRKGRKVFAKIAKKKHPSRVGEFSLAFFAVNFLMVKSQKSTEEDFEFSGAGA